MEAGALLAGKYRLVRQLGDGGMGTVFEARHEVLGTSFAIKVLHSDLARKPGLVDRFLREAHVAAQLKSPHIVQVFDVDRTQDGTAYIVMELLGGEPLGRVLDRERRLPVPTAIQYTLQILSGLEVAHAANVVHRDLKPENVYVTPGANGGAPILKLIDFGIAKLRSSDPTTKNLTAFGVVMGTPEYMAPEQAFSADRADARADIYAVGVLLYEMIAGSRPASGDDAQTVAGKVHRGEIVPLVHAAPHVPRELAGLVHRAMAPRPEMRFTSASEMATALRAVMVSLGQPLPQGELMPSTMLAPPLGSAAPPPVHERRAEPQITGPAPQKTAPPDAYAVSPGPPPYGYTPAPPQLSYPEAPPPRRRKKSKIGWIIGIPLLLGAAGAAVVLAIQNAPTSDNPPPIFPTSTTPVVTPTAPTVTTPNIPTTQGGGDPLPPLVTGNVTTPVPPTTTKPPTTKPSADAAPGPSANPTADGGAPPSGSTTSTTPPVFPPFPSGFPSSLPFPMPSAIPLPSGFPPIPSGFPFPGFPGQPPK